MVLNPSLKYMPKYSGSDYELKVSRCKMDDKGEYIVRAVNSFGSKEESAALSVERELFKKNQNSTWSPACLHGGGLA